VLLPFQHGEEGTPLHVVSFATRRSIPPPRRILFAILIGGYTPPHHQPLSKLSMRT
jgi:hypothetical protein